MRCVINNHNYDTDRDRLIYTVKNGEAENSAKYYQEDLYENGAGLFYLRIFGGIDTPAWIAYGGGTDMGGFAHACGEQIKPLAYDEARAWAAKNMPAQAGEIF